MNRMSTPDEASDVAQDTEPVRRKGDRRTTVQAVAEDRRKGDRRDIPGFSALIRTLFRRPGS